MAYCIINLLFETQLPFYNFILYYIYDFSSFHNIIRIICGYFSFCIPIIVYNNNNMAYNHDRFAVRIFVYCLCAQHRHTHSAVVGSAELQFCYERSYVRSPYNLCRECEFSISLFVCACGFCFVFNKFMDIKAESSFDFWVPSFVFYMQIKLEGDEMCAFFCCNAARSWHISCKKWRTAMSVCHIFFGCANDILLFRKCLGKSF